MFFNNKAYYYGMFYKKGTVIGKVINSRVAEDHLYELKTEKRTLESRGESLVERLHEYNQLRDSLSKKMIDYSQHFQIQILIQIEREKLEMLEEKAENTRAKKYFTSSKDLKSKRAVSDRSYDTHESLFEQSNQRLLQIKENIKELENVLEAAKHGIFLGNDGSNNDSPYSKQRMDQMVIEISLAKTAKKEAANRIKGIDSQIVTEQKWLDKAKSFSVISPFDALVWRIVPTEGGNVVVNSEIIVLLDCSSIFLDASISGAMFSSVHVGENIEYKLLSEAKFHQGKVIALRGSGSVTDDLNLAATLERDSAKEFQIWIKPDPTDLDLRPETFYQVGRRVNIRINRKFDIMKSLSWFRNVL